MKKIRTRVLAIALISAVAVGSMPPGVAQAAKVTPGLSASKVSLRKGSKKKIKIRNAAKAKVKSVKWTVDKKGKKVISLTGKSKKGVTIKARKKGKAVITAKIKTKTRTWKKKIRVTVTKKPAKAGASSTPESTPEGTAGSGTPAPAATATPVQTQAGPAPVPTSTASVEQTPLPTVAATPSPVPEVTKMPVSTAKPEMTPAVYGTPGTAVDYDREKANYTLDINAADEVHDISDMLYGIFFEDINFAADGGLYAEMVQNRSFEFTELAAGDEKHAWSDVGEGTAEVTKNDVAGGLNANNPNYMVLSNESGTPAGIANKGFLDGMSVNKDARYRFSVWAKGLDGYTGPIHVAVRVGDRTVAEGEIPEITAEWAKYELELVSSETAFKDVKLEVTIDKGKAAVDMVSLFPEDTYKNRENGMRKDLAEKLEALHPRFLRFPGGCVIEGGTLDEAYDWKASIGVGPDGEPLEFNGTYGDVAARKQNRNLWTDENATEDENPSFMTYGLGFYEFFQLSEDIGAIGVPIVNCGISCLIPGNPQITEGDEYQKYIQDALDLVEFCRGGKDTKWGAVRIAMGHEEPFALKYIGIGNEQWGKDFYEHYEGFVDAFARAKEEDPEMYGDIELMYSAGVDDGDSGLDYRPAYAEAKKWLNSHPGQTVQDFAGIIDHHYYNDPAWFYSHADYYDEENYSRTSLTGTKFCGGLNVFLGEYASRSNTWNSALSEAAYMTGLERNGDIVKMAAYAPLFGNITALHWAPDLIWFNNHTSTASVNYYVQKAFADNAGTALLGTSFTGAVPERKEFRGKVGVGTWNTAASFDNVKITNNDTGETLAYDNFDSEKSLELNWQKVSDGSWSVKDGRLVQSSTKTNTELYGVTGSTLYFGDVNWENYTYTVEATKTAGEEGFLIPIAVGSARNNYFWNIGGWANKTSCLQKVTDGVKSDQLTGTARNISIKNGTVYKLKVVVNGFNIKCYVNNSLYINYTAEQTANAESYQVVSTDETGDIIIKLVNVTRVAKTFAIDIAGAGNVGDTAKQDLAAGDSLAADNILGEEEAVTLKTSEVPGIKEKFNYTVPKYSVSVLRVRRAAGK